MITAIVALIIVIIIIFAVYVLRTPNAGPPPAVAQWTCITADGVNYVPVRRNVRTNLIECASGNGLDCSWGDKPKCVTGDVPNANNPDRKPVACSDERTGWCAVAAKTLPMWKL